MATTAFTEHEKDQQISQMSERIEELIRENSNLARAVAGIPSSLEQRKVVALETIAGALTNTPGHNGDVFTQLGDIRVALVNLRGRDE